MNLRIGILFYLLVLTSLVGMSGNNYTVDSQGNVVFTSTLENLPLTADEIHQASLAYLEDAYKYTSFQKVESNMQSKSAKGLGEFSGLHTQGGLVTSQVYSTKFHMCIDAKDGRARIRVIVRNYDIVWLSDVGSKNAEQLLVSQCEPIGDAYSSKGHKKAFTILCEKVDALLAEATNTLKNTMPSNSSDSTDW